jgi:excisionase family DNA binding protein
MTLAEAAPQLGVSADYLRVAANRGSLKAEKIGRDWFVTQSELDRYANENLGKLGRPRNSNTQEPPK